MRQRKASETAINKTLNFLLALQHKCEGTDFAEYTTTQLHIAFKVSKSTYSVCKKLEIVRETRDGVEWLKQNPDRPMCLQVLGVLLEQAKKEIVTPISQDWTALNETLRDISEKITIGLQRSNSASQGFKTPTKEAKLFDAQEKRDEQRFELLKAIATGAYSHPQTLENVQTYDRLNADIITITDDLLYKYNSK